MVGFFGRSGVPVTISIVETGGGPTSPLGFSNGVPLFPWNEPSGRREILEKVQSRKSDILSDPGPSESSSRLDGSSILQESPNPVKNAKVTKSSPKTDQGGGTKSRFGDPGCRVKSMF